MGKILLGTLPGTSGATNPMRDGDGDNDKSARTAGLDERMRDDCSFASGGGFEHEDVVVDSLSKKTSAQKEDAASDAASKAPSGRQIER